MRLTSHESTCFWNVYLLTQKEKSNPAESCSCFFISTKWNHHMYQRGSCVCCVFQVTSQVSFWGVTTNATWGQQLSAQSTQQRTKHLTKCFLGKTAASMKSRIQQALKKHLWMRTHLISRKPPCGRHRQVCQCLGAKFTGQVIAYLCSKSCGRRSAKEMHKALCFQSV